MSRISADFNIPSFIKSWKPKVNKDGRKKREIERDMLRRILFMRQIDGPESR